MASITLKVSDRFPVGTSVGAYPASARVPGSSPSAAVVETETVQTAGTLTFTALVENTAYVAYANVGGQDRYVSFGTQHENQASLIDTSGAADGQVATWDSGSEALVLANLVDGTVAADDAIAWNGAISRLKSDGKVAINLRNSGVAGGGDLTSWLQGVFDAGDGLEVHCYTPRAHVLGTLQMRADVRLFGHGVLQLTQDPAAIHPMLWNHFGDAFAGTFGPIVEDLGKVIIDDVEFYSDGINTQGCIDIAYPDSFLLHKCRFFNFNGVAARSHNTTAWYLNNYAQDCGTLNGVNVFENMGGRDSYYALQSDGGKLWTAFTYLGAATDIPSTWAVGNAIVAHGLPAGTTITGITRPNGSLEGDAAGGDGVSTFRVSNNNTWTTTAQELANTTRDAIDHGMRTDLGPFWAKGNTSVRARSAAILFQNGHGTTHNAVIEGNYALNSEWWGMGAETKSGHARFIGNRIVGGYAGIGCSINQAYGVPRANYQSTHELIGNDIDLRGSTYAGSHGAAPPAGIVLSGAYAHIIGGTIRIDQGRAIDLSGEVAYRAAWPRKQIKVLGPAITVETPDTTVDVIRLLNVDDVEIDHTSIEVLSTKQSGEGIAIINSNRVRIGPGYRTSNLGLDPVTVVGPCAGIDIDGSHVDPNRHNTSIRAAVVDLAGNGTDKPDDVTIRGKLRDSTGATLYPVACRTGPVPTNVRYLSEQSDMEGLANAAPYESTPGASIIEQRFGTLAQRPTWGPHLYGKRYFATDVWGGTDYYADATGWQLLNRRDKQSMFRVFDVETCDMETGQGTAMTSGTIHAAATIPRRAGTFTHIYIAISSNTYAAVTDFRLGLWDAPGTTLLGDSGNIVGVADENGNTFAAGASTSRLYKYPIVLSRALVEGEILYLGAAGVTGTSMPQPFAVGRPSTLLGASGLLTGKPRARAATGFLTGAALPAAITNSTGALIPYMALS